MKTIDELAIFGGEPTFAEILHVGRPNIGDRGRLMARMNDILDRRWLTNDGIYVEEFEKRAAEYVGVKHCIATCNATIALEMTARALDLKGEVIVPSFTFVATAHSLQWQEITPVFCDIDPATHCLDPARVEAQITPRTTGIIGVHLWGRACDVDGLAAVAGRHNLTLLFDAAHAFGCSYKGKMIGNFGAAEVYSFHATKFINCFEGGMIATNSDELARKLRLMKNFGFNGYDKVIYIGTNGKLCEASAAMGLTNLESMGEFVEVNLRNYQVYLELLGNIPGIQLHEYHGEDRTNYQYIVAEFDRDAAGISRDQLIDILWKENVHARRYFFPGCHRMEPYRSYFPHAGLLLPVTEAVAERILVLPTGTATSVEQIESICELIRIAVQHSQEIQARWKQG